MNEDRWDTIRQKIKDSFTVLEEYTDELNPGTADTIEFETPQGILKAAFIRRPKVVNKKTIYSRRVGGDVSVDYEYSSDEIVCHLNIEKWNESNQRWDKIDDSLF